MSTGSANKSYKVINISYLLDMADNSPELVLEVIGIFKSQLPDFEKRFNTYLENKDIENLKKTAHKVKSALSVMGISTFNDDLKYFDGKTPEELNLQEFEAFVGNFQSTCKVAIMELEQVIDTYKKLKDELNTDYKGN